MTTDNVTVSRELLDRVLCRIDTGSPEWDIGVLIDTLRAALEQPLVEPEMHEAMCPALTGCKCNCPTSPAFVDKAWAQFCGGVGRGPGAPYPGMIEAFEAHYGQSFTDRDWRNESSIWAAAWKAVKAHQPPQPQQPVRRPVAWWKQYPDGNVSVFEGKVFLTEDALCCGWRPLGFVDASPQAQQPAPPADVPLLSDEEIGALVREASKGGALNRDGSTSQRIARAIEQAVRRNAGLK